MADKKEKKKGFSLSKNTDKKVKLKAGKLPVKRSINLATVGEEHIDMRLALPLILLIILLAAAFSKIFVVNRLMEMSEAQGKVASLQTQLDDSYKQIEAYTAETADYAHYTYADMTAEELSRTDREDVIDLIDRLVLPYASIGSFKISENILELPITSGTLQDINEIVQRLEEDPLVDFCMITTAQTLEQSEKTVGEEAQSWYESVTGQVTVYLNEKAEESQEDSGE